MSYQLNKIPATNSKEVSIDTEIFEMEKNKLHRPTGHFAALTICDGDEVWIITDETLVPLALEAVKDKLWIMHNASFDLFHLRRWADIPERTGHNLWDTMVWERLLWNGYYDKFSLDDVARRYLDVKFDKKIRKEFEKATHMTFSMLEYAAKDARYTFSIKKAQHAEAVIKDYYTDLMRLWVDIEAPMIETLLQFKGFKMDVVAWNSIAEGHEQMRDDIKTRLGFNPASPKQTLAKLHQQGIRVTSTAAGVLEQHKDNHIVKSILKFRKAAKLAGTYGKKFLEKYLESDNKVYSNYRSIGASTGRSASNDPNMQNIPHDKIYRGSFVASPGNKLIVLDYSQQEVRITAFHSGDEKLLEILAAGGDTHLETARLLFDNPNIQKNDPERYIGKTINLAIVYGLTAYNLASRMNNYYSQQGSNQVMTVDEAQNLIDAYFRAFPGVKEFIDHQRWLASRNGYVTTQMGRVCWVNKYNKQWLNNAINSPIQGGAADQMKIALIKLRELCEYNNLPYLVVAMVHDEIVLDVPEEQARLYKDLASNAMYYAGNTLYPDVAWKVDAVISDSWAGKE